MMRTGGLLALALAMGSSTGTLDNAELKEQVRKTEAAFARTMADRDHAAFASFLADETVFLGRTTLSPPAGP